MKKLTMSVILAATFVLAACTQNQRKDDASQQNLEVVRGMYNAFANGDIPTVLAGMDPQIEWNEAENFPYADGNPYIGPDAVVNGVFARLGSEWEYWNLTALKFHGMAGNMVLATGRYQAKYKQNGGIIDAQFAHLWTLQDGKVVRFQQYTDTEQVMRVMRRL